MTKKKRFYMKVAARNACVDKFFEDVLLRFKNNSYQLDTGMYEIIIQRVEPPEAEKRSPRGPRSGG